MAKFMNVKAEDMLHQQDFEFVVKCKGVGAIHTRYPPKYINSLPKRDVEQFYNAHAEAYPVTDAPDLQMVAEDEEKYGVSGDNMDDWHDP